MKTLKEGHKYELENFALKNMPGQTIQFIEKVKDMNSNDLITVSDGTTNEEVLEVMLNRMVYLQSKFPCQENLAAMHNIKEALHWLNKRTEDRIKRGVEGKHQE